MKTASLGGIRDFWLGIWVSACAWSYPALALAAGNQGELVSGSWIRPAGVLWLAGMLAFPALSAVFRSWSVGAVATALASFWVFHFWDVTQMFRDWVGWMASDPADILRLCLVPWAVGFGATLLVARWKQDWMERLLPALAFAMLVLLVQPAWVLGTRRPDPSKPFAQARGIEPPPDLRASMAPNTGDKPDIFLVVLDAYGRDDALRHYLGIDNRDFLRELEKRGFMVAQHSQSNYNQTLLALSSMLNGAFIQDLPIPTGSKEPIAVAPWIASSRLRAIWEKHGLRTVNVPSATTVTEIATADWIVSDPNPVPKGTLAPLELLLVDRSPLSLLPKRQFSEEDRHREAIEFAFDSLPRVASQTFPKFVLAHLLVPHPPFLFDADGQPVDSPTTVGALEDGSDLLRHLSKDEYRRRYAGQLAFANRKMLEAVDGIRKHSKRPVAIILLGDHGSRLNTDFRSMAKTDPGESSRILMAVSLPGMTEAEKKTVDTLSPVNVLRFVLSARFGENLPLLPNRGWFSTFSDAFAFLEVPDASGRLDESAPVR